jgi:hypothetical protein
MASVVMALVIGSIGTLASAVEESSSYSYSVSTAHQHGRVAIERIQAAVNGAASSSTEPPVAVIADSSGTYTFPDTLVVWKSDANNDDIPQVGELVVYCPNPSAANELWELSDPTNTTATTLATPATLRTVVGTMKASGSTTKTVLTSLVRTVTAADLASTRAAVRFDVELRPSAVEWAQYKANTLAWTNLSWAQGICGSTTGLRQAWLRFEIQLAPEDNDGVPADAAEVRTFFGSATVCYELAK